MNPIDEKLKILQPVLGKGKTAKLRLAYHIEDDYRAKKEIENRIDLLIATHVKKDASDQIILPPPDGCNGPGDLAVGTVRYADKPMGEFRITGQDMIRHVGVFGATGSGKTTLIYNLMRQLLSQGRPFLVLDWKRDYRDLLNNPEFKGKIKVLTAGRDIAPFRFNPKVKPPGVDAHVWMKHLIEIISHAYLLGPGAEDVIRENMHAPTFQEMQEKLNKQQKRARELLWWASAKRTLNAINFPGLSEVVNCHDSNLLELLEGNFILELDGLSDLDKVFLIGSMLMWIYYHRMSQEGREQWKHTIILEEAHHLLLKRGSQAETYADTLMREVRVFGQAMVIIDQRPSKISDSAMANINTKVCMSLNHETDVRAMSRSLLLDRYQDKFLGMLQVGEAIIKSYRLASPFQAALPRFEIQKGAFSDEMLKKLNPKPSGPAAPAQAGIEVCRVPHAPQMVDNPPPGRLQAMEKCVLSDISEHPFDGVEARSKRLGLHPSQMSTLHESLGEKRIIRPVQVGLLKLFDITTEGRRIAEMNGIKIRKMDSRGGIEHAFAVHQTMQHMSKLKFRPACEVGDIDIVDAGNGIAIEIETGKSNIIANLMKLDECGHANLFMLATTKPAEFKIKARQPDFPNVRFMHIKDFLKLSPSQITSRSHQSEASAITEH